MTTVFLCGGEPALALSAPRFVELLRGQRVALCLQGGPKLWQYVPRYVNPWIAQGLAGCDVIAPGEDGTLDEAQALAVLDQAGGVFVGGGNTAVYHRLYACGAVGEIIRSRCLAGLPYGGLSAGMLIAGAVCPLDPDETGEPEVRLERGLGLFADALYEPHFSALDRRANLEAYLRLSGIPMGFGVDDGACVVLQPGKEMEVIWGGVTRVQGEQR